jgi:hypothetical protein
MVPRRTASVGALPNCCTSETLVGHCAAKSISQMHPDIEPPFIKPTRASQVSFSLESTAQAEKKLTRVAPVQEVKVDSALEDVEVEGKGSGPAGEAKMETASSRGKTPRSSKSRSPRPRDLGSANPRATSKEQSSSSGEKPSTLEDPIDDSEDDGSGPRGTAFPKLYPASCM